MISDGFDPTTTTKVYRADPPLPTAQPLGATVEDTDIAVAFATLDGPIEIHMGIEFAKQLVSQLRTAVQDAQDQHRPTRQF
jgi:hypothetical protein